MSPVWRRALARQTALELAGALGVAWAVRAALPLGADDPFRASLVLLPVVVAALRGLERPAPRRAAGSPAAGSPAAGRGEVVALGVLVLLTLSRHSLGLAASDWFLAGGFVLLLAHRVARLLPCWLPALARGRVAIAFFFLPLVVYLALLPWQAAARPPDGDEPFYLLLTHSLAHDFDAELGNNYAAADWRAFMDRPIEPQPGDPRGPGGEVYSRHNLLLPLVLAPAYRVGGRWGAMAMMAVMTAALAWQVLALARRQGSAGAALTAYAVFAFGPPLLLFSYQIWIEVPAALVVALLFGRVRDLPRDARPLQLFVVVALLALLPLLKLRLGLVALPLAALAVYRLRPAARALVAGGFAAALGAVLLHNLLRYGNLLKIHRWSELDVVSSSLGDVANGGVGMFYDSAFGLFPNAPIWALLIPAVWLLLRRQDLFLGELALVAVPYLAVLVPRVEWYGGWSPPFRYPLVFLPLLALALVPLLEHRRRPALRALIVALGALTVVLSVIWVVEPGWTYNFADGRTRLLDQAGVRLGADVARLFPSTVRYRTATWVWPLASVLLIPLAAWRGRARWRRAAGVWGFAAVLAAAAAVPLAARHAPTRVVELEDAWVAKQRGSGFPDVWVRQRTRYAGGWVIPPRGQAVAPIAAGGATARLRLVARRAKPGVRSRLVLAAGGTPLARVDVADGGWQELELGPFAWPPGAALVLHGGGPAFPGRVAVDRVEWTWK